MSRSSLCLFLILICVPSLTAAGGFPPNQPFASYWFPNELLTWDPATDPDAPYNRSRVPLAGRFLYPGTQVNSHARAGEGRVTALSIMYPSTSDNPSQGSLDFDVFAFNYWQYLEGLTFWGGSAGEGLILAPNPGVIDAAHRNGVKVYGTIFFPPNVFGGDISWVQDLVQTVGETYPVGDKLIEAAEYYGFDGWFINQETSGGDAALATAIQDFMKYVRENSDLQIMWYDSMIESGPISWQNELNSLNDAFFDEGTAPVSDEFFLNFFWNSSRLTSSASLASSLGRSEYELYAGADVQANGSNTPVNWAALFPEAEAHRTSLGLFAPNWTFTDAADNADFYARANRFWVGANRDPSNTTTPDAWKGIAHYVPAWSAIDSMPFVTHFNTGQGHLFAVDGEVRSTVDWNNRGLQEILPTWRWLQTPSAVRQAGAGLLPEIDWTDSYYGGAALKVSGDLDAPERLDLFKTQLVLSAGGSLQIIYKTGASGPSHLKAAIAFEDAGGVTPFEILDVGSSTTTEWNIVDLDLSAYAGETMAMLSLSFEAPAAVPGYEIFVGRIAVLGGPESPPAPPSGAFVEDVVETSPEAAALRLRWSHSLDPVTWYNVYRRNADETLTYLGGTANNAYFVAALPREGDEGRTTIEIQAVGPGYSHSAPATTTFDWGPLFVDGFESGDTSAW